MNLYLWESVEAMANHGNGMVVIMAESKEEAIKTIREKRAGDVHHVEEWRWSEEKYDEDCTLEEQEVEFLECVLRNPEAVKAIRESRGEDAS